MTTHPLSPTLLADLTQRRAAITVVGLGYVGLPLAVCLAKHFRVIGFDVNPAKIAALRAGRDPVGESGDARIQGSAIEFTADPQRLRDARFHIIAVPTPVDQAKRPDFTALISASATVGRNLERGSVVVYESTVYPGATEEICVPVLERESGLRAGVDFTFGYSPERINPGDKEHTVERILKLVSGSDAPTLDLIAGVYGTAIAAGVYRAASVKVAEAAKVIENTQRDLNIALMNELALIFHRIGIDTMDVLEAAGTKWNFLPFRPGLVGGHCIGVDPYYLTHKADELGYHTHVILAGRRINDDMGQWIAQECIRLIILNGKHVRGAKILILGVTFKENCPDVRNSKIFDIVNEITRFGAEVILVDPLANPDEVHHEYGVTLTELTNVTACDGIIAAVRHTAFASLQPTDLAALTSPGAPFIDVKSAFNREALHQAGFTVWRL